MSFETLNPDSVYFAPRAFSMLRAEAFNMHHDREALGEIAVLAAQQFGPEYGLKQGPEDRTLVYRFARAGINQDIEPSIHDSHLTRYYHVSQLAVPHVEDCVTTSRDVILRDKPVLDVWFPALHPHQSIVKHYVNALIEQPPEDANFVVSGGAWRRFLSEFASPLLPGPKRTPSARAAFTRRILTTYDTAITLDLR